MKLFRLELKRSIKSNLIWSISLGITMFSIIIIYPMVMDMMDALNEMIDYLESINSSFVDFINDFGGIPQNGVEYFATEGAMILQLAAGIYAAMIGFQIINKDDKEKTVEVLYTLPIHRISYLFQKMLVVFVEIFIFMASQILFVIIGFVIVSPGEAITELFMFGLFDMMMMLMISYLSMGLALVLKPQSSSFIPMAIPIPLYVITTIAYATDNATLKLLKYISPFTFAEPVGFLKDHTDFEWLNFLIYTIFTLAVIGFSIYRFRRREII